MPTAISCPQCQARYTVKDGQAGKSFRCKKCAASITIPSPESVIELEVPPALPTPRPESDPHLNFFISAMWLLVGFNAALLTPWLNGFPIWLTTLYHLVMPLVTVALIAWNLIAALKIVGRTGRAFRAWRFTLAQLALFVLLFFQIAAHFGMSHYQWDRNPGIFDWIGFGLVHLIRAGDVLDLFHAYGIKLQTIQHSSTLVAAVLLVFHLIVDLFLIRVFLDVLASLRRRVFSAELLREIPLDTESTRAIMSRWGISFRSLGYGLLGLFALLWFLTVVFFRPRGFIEIVVWPIENVVRVADFTDSMELFHLRLSSVPASWWEGTLTFIFRVMVAVWLGNILLRWSRRLSLRYFGGYSLSPADLDEIIRSDADATMRESASRRLAQIASIPEMKQSTWREWATLWPRRVWQGIGGAALLLLFLPLLLSDWSSAADGLVRDAIGRDATAANRACHTLSHMGTYAESAVPRLMEAFHTVDSNRQEWIVWTLGYLGPTGLSTLTEVAIGDAKELAHDAVDAMEHIGPRAAIAVGRTALVAIDPEIRRRAKSLLNAFGREGAYVMMDRMREEDVGVVFAYLDRLEPYWQLYPSRNLVFQKQLALRAKNDRGISAAMAVFSDDAAPQEALFSALQMASAGPTSAPLAPYLIRRIAQRNVLKLDETMSALGSMREAGADAVPRLLEIVLDTQNTHRADAMRSIRNIGSASVPIIYDRYRQLSESDSERIAILGVLCDIQPIHPAVVTLLVEAIDEPNNRTVARNLSMKLAPAVRVRVARQMAKLFENGTPEDRLWVFDQLTGAEDEVTMRSLMRALHGPEAIAAKAASLVELLWMARGREPKAYEAVVPAVIESVRALPIDAELPLQIHAMAALSRPANDTAEAIPLIERFVLSENHRIRDHAINLFRNRVNQHHAQILPILGSCLERYGMRDEELATGIALWLAGFRESGREAVPLLVSLLKHESIQVRQAAARALGAIGPSASAALPILEAMTTDTGYGNIRMEAYRATLAIKKKP